jgi:colanic acid/amylovoran biosynthesis glycosyltransferase
LIHYITTNGIGNAWVPNELHELQRAGIPFALHAMRKPEHSYHLSTWAADINRGTRFIYPLPPFGMGLSIVLAPILFGPRFLRALANACFAKRENLRSRLAAIAHLFVACHWARSLRHQKVDLIHSQWIHSCGTIGMYGAWLLGAPFSFTGHATDLFRDRVALNDKIRRADFIICISSFHRDFYLENGARPEQLHIVYCGIDPTLFQPGQKECLGPDSRLRIRSSGRLVEKKGFTDLIMACRTLAERGVRFDCVIAGSGPDQEALQQDIEATGLQGQISLTGTPLAQEDIPEFMHGGDLYCLPCVWASDNDVDGLPQMLMEAMACGLPVVSTRLVGIPDLVLHEETGLLVEPNDSPGLANAIERLHADRALAGRLAMAGREHVLAKFDIRTCLEPLLDQFRKKLGFVSKHQYTPDAPARESVESLLSCPSLARRASDRDAEPGFETRPTSAQ